MIQLYLFKKLIFCSLVFCIFQQSVYADSESIYAGLDSSGLFRARYKADTGAGVFFILSSFENGNFDFAEAGYSGSCFTAGRLKYTGLLSRFFNPGGVTLSGTKEFTRSGWTATSSFSRSSIFGLAFETDSCNAWLLRFNNKALNAGFMTHPLKAEIDSAAVFDSTLTAAAGLTHTAELNDSWFADHAQLPQQHIFFIRTGASMSFPPGRNASLMNPAESDKPALMFDLTAGGSFPEKTEKGYSCSGFLSAGGKLLNARFNAVWTGKNFIRADGEYAADSLAAGAGIYSSINLPGLVLDSSASYTIQNSAEPIIPSINIPGDRKVSAKIKLSAGALSMSTEGYKKTNYYSNGTQMDSYIVKSSIYYSMACCTLGTGGKYFSELESDGGFCGEITAYFLFTFFTDRIETELTAETVLDYDGERAEPENYKLSIKNEFCSERYSIEADIGLDIIPESSEHSNSTCFNPFFKLSFRS